jgi:hypothetical protein
MQSLRLQAVIPNYYFGPQSGQRTLILIKPPPPPPPTAYSFRPPDLNCSSLYHLIHGPHRTGFFSVRHALAWAMNTLWTRPCLSCLSRFFCEVSNPHEPGHCWNTLLSKNGNRGQCWDTLLQQWDPRSLLGTLTIMENEVIVGAQWPWITLRQWLGIIVAFIIPFQEGWSKSTAAKQSADVNALDMALRTWWPCEAFGLRLANLSTENVY